MATVSEVTNERRLGFVVEETISGCSEGCMCPRMQAIPAAEYGDEVFADLTEGLGVRQHSGWEELDGRCPRCDAEVKYRRMFVVSEVVRTTTLVTAETIG